MMKLMIQDNIVEIKNYKVISKELTSEGIGKSRELVRGMEYVEVTHWEEIYLMKIEINGQIIKITEIVKTKQKPNAAPFYTGHIVEDYRSEKILAKMFDLNYVDLYAE